MFTANVSRKQLSWFIVIGLALVTLAIYAPILRHGFVNYDDADYITDNLHVTAGVTWSGIVWAFTNDEAANWHPLTWVSHMVDCDLFGLYAGGHHLVNLLFHIANTLLLFLWLKQMTGALWRSAFVAAFFAWHPLHVESVAWAAERKDVLSTFFWLLTLMAYTSYVQRRAKLETKGAPLNYCLALLLFACGLMSKPMVVTLPFVLLLLDFWPLQRFSLSTFNFPLLLRLVVEKIPFFALAVAGSMATYSAQQAALWTSASLSLQFRLANIMMSYERYLAKLCWPTDLALIYPYPHSWTPGQVAGAGLLLVLVTAVFLWRLRQNPYLCVGWFWFLGTLVPAIGLVQVGIQSMADRYTYIPSIGFFIVVVWGLNDLLNRWPERKKFLALAGGVALAGCLMVTSIQINYWQDSVKLFSHAIAVTRDNYGAYNCLGDTLEKLGRKDEALTCYAKTVEIEPDFPAGQFNLGMMMLEHGQPDKALTHLTIAAQLTPHNPVIRFDLGLFLLQHGKPAEAIGHFNAALKDKPDFAEARQYLDQALDKSNSPTNPPTPTP